MGAALTKTSSERTANSANMMLLEDAFSINTELV